MTSQELLDALSSPHVARAWFVRLDLPSGEWRVHTGSGSVYIGGERWQGITDPIGGTLVGISTIDEPRFGSAVAVTLTLSGPNEDFILSVHTNAREIEGRAADIYFAHFDTETQQIIGGLQPLFARGRMTAPSIEWQGVDFTRVSVTIESIWSTHNFAPGGMWNDAGQQRRYPGDRGLEFVGQKISENWQ